MLYGYLFIYLLPALTVDFTYVLSFKRYVFVLIFVCIIINFIYFYISHRPLHINYA